MSEVKEINDAKEIMIRFDNDIEKLVIRDSTIGLIFDC